MIFGKYINRYYLKNAPLLLLGLAALVLVDFFQLKVPELYRMVINGTNSGEVVVDGQTMAFTMDVLLDKICLPMIWIILAMVFGRFLWRVCFFNAAGPDGDRSPQQDVRPQPHALSGILPGQ